MHKVIINGNVFYAPDGTFLSDIIISSGINHPHPCGCNGSCRKCTVTVNGRPELSCRYRIFRDIEVKASSEDSGLTDADKNAYGAEKSFICALDIGTTTLALLVIDPDSKEVISMHSDINPQRIFGADILSRIDSCKKYSVEAVRKPLIEKINSMLDKSGIKNISEFFVAGNTVMLHIFFGENPEGIGVSPYTPVFLDEKRVTGQSVGIPSADTVYSLPSVHAFIGADITAGLNCADFSENGRYSLLVDLGTNAEVVLFSKDKILCTAAAAGPCFEGANISCGMTAVKGAIYSYRNANDFDTIGSTSPVGICATALIDIIAILIQNEIIDENGYLESGEFRICDGITLKNEDIRQFQLAKSAVISAIKTLAEKVGISLADIDRLYISGGFASEINKNNAVTTGLIPQQLKNRTVTLKNSCLEGMLKYIREKNDLKAIVSSALYTDLASDGSFSEHFIKNMQFGQSVQ